MLSCNRRVRRKNTFPALPVASGKFRDDPTTVLGTPCGRTAWVYVCGHERVGEEGEGRAVPVWLLCTQPLLVFLFSGSSWCTLHDVAVVKRALSLYLTDEFLSLCRLATLGATVLRVFKAVSRFFCVGGEGRGVRGNIVQNSWRCRKGIF